MGSKAPVQPAIDDGRLGNAHPINHSRTHPQTMDGSYCRTVNSQYHTFDVHMLHITYRKSRVC